MSANDDEINRREVAWRLFASEFRDADFSYAESDEERAPNYVVTPTGARVNRLFVVGVLTEVEYVSDDYLRARIVDPTGAFVVYAGQYQPEALTFLENAETPTFVAVTGKARTFQPDDSDVVYTSIRPEAISEVDAASRDNWVVTTAEQTLERIATMADALDLVERGDDLRAVLEARHVPQGLAAGIPLAIDHYGTTEHYLAAVRDVSLDAARVVAGERDEVEQYRIDPDETGDEPVALGLDDFTLVTGNAQPVTTTEPAETEPATETEPTDADAAAETSAADEVEPDAEVETDAETEPDTETEVDESAESEPEPETVEATTAGTSTESAETEPAGEGTGESETEADTDATPDEEDAAEAVDTDEMYELSEEERKEVEENYDVEFSTADEVEGEAGIEPETPQPDVEETADESAATDASASEESASEETAEDLAFDADTDEEAEETAAEFEADHEDDADAEPSDEESEGTTTENLEDAVVETMQSLGDGAGADRDELVQTVVEEHGVDQDAVEDAIQDALMSGRCYESGDDELTAI